MIENRSYHARLSDSESRASCSSLCYRLLVCHNLHARVGDHPPRGILLFRDARQCLLGDRPSRPEVAFTPRNNIFLQFTFSSPDSVAIYATLLDLSAPLPSRTPSFTVGTHKQFFDNSVSPPSNPASPPTSPGNHLAWSGQWELLETMFAMGTGIFQFAWCSLGKMWKSRTE
jgi:hypothetical protein